MPPMGKHSNLAIPLVCRGTLEELIKLKSRFQDLLKADDAKTRRFPIVDELFSTPVLNVADTLKPVCSKIVFPNEPFESGDQILAHVLMAVANQQHACLAGMR